MNTAAKFQGIINLLKNAVGIIFIPVIIAVTKSFYTGLMEIGTLTEVLKYFLSGSMAYIIIYIAFSKLDYIYIFGHESVHALCVWLLGGRLLSFKVSKEGGSVTATKTNLFIEIMPYLVPVYTIFVFLFYITGRSFFPSMSSFFIYFMFLMGFTFSFHIVMTIDKMKIEQPDFISLGYLNSIELIYITNILVTAALLVFLLPEFSLRGFFEDSVLNAREIYAVIQNQLFSL